MLYITLDFIGPLYLTHDLIFLLYINTGAPIIDFWPFSYSIDTNVFTTKRLGESTTDTDLVLHREFFNYYYYTRGRHTNGNIITIGVLICTLWKSKQALQRLCSKPRDHMGDDPLLTIRLFHWINKRLQLLLEPSQTFYNRFLYNVEFWTVISSNFSKQHSLFISLFISFLRLKANWLLEHNRIPLKPKKISSCVYFEFNRFSEFLRCSADVSWTTAFIIFLSALKRRHLVLTTSHRTSVTSWMTSKCRHSMK